MKINTRFPSRPVVLRAIADGDPARLLPGASNPSLFTRHAAALDAAEARVRNALGKPIPPIPWSVFKLFAETGDRRQGERPYFQRRTLLGDLEILLLAGRDPDGAYTALLEDLLWEICNEYTWSLPAHLWRASSGDPGVRNERHTLDLFASETGFYLAELLHFLGDRLSPRLVARCRAEIKDRTLDSYLGPYEVLHWEHGYNNWAAVCAGSIGGAFLYEERDPSRLERALSRVLATMEAFIDSFPSDAACEEGVGYWSYGFGYFALFAEMLFEYTDGALDLFDNPDVHAIAHFPQRAQLGVSRTISFSDGDRRYAPSPMLTALFRRHYDDIEPCDGTLGTGSAMKPGHFLRSFLWSDPAEKGASVGDATTYFPDMQWLVVRHAPFSFAACFGSNWVSHNHNDVGSFLVVDGNREGPMDLGSGTYTRQYFGAERYGDTILCCGSQGHSVPVVRGACQKNGPEFTARDVRFEERPDGSLVLSGDIAGAYGLPFLRSLRRTFTVRPAQGVVEVADEFDLADGRPAKIDTATCPADGVVERFIGFEKAELVGPGKVRFGAFVMSFDSALSAVVHTLPFCTHRAVEATEVSMLDIALPDGVQRFSATLRAERSN